MSTLRDIAQDVRYAARTAGRAPSFTATAVLTLAVGIGATVGTFTIVNAVLLRPLPIRAPQELVAVDAKNVSRGGYVGASWTKYQFVRDHNRVFADVSAWIGRDFAFSDGATAEQVNGARVTWNFFDTLGIVPAAGRTFRADEDRENAPAVAIVSDGLVRRRYGGDARAVVGRSVAIEGRSTTIIGSLPPGFRFQFTDAEPQIYLTSVFTPGGLTAAQIRHGAGFLGYIGRLQNGINISQVTRELALLDRRYREQFGSYTDASRFALHAVPFTQNLLGDVRPGLLVVMGAVALVLLISCANVAHLLLARVAVRQHEIAVRLAIGAGRGRLVRQLLTESSLLALTGCALGWWAVSMVIDVLVTYAPPSIPRLRDAQPDASVLLFAVGVSAVTVLLVGIMPAVRATSVRVGELLKDGRPDGSTNRATGRVHQLLAASETAVTVTLLVGAGLLMQSFLRMQRVHVGFEPGSVYTARVSLPQTTYPTPGRRERFFTELLESVRREPGLASVGAISYLPMGGSNYGFFFYREESPERDNVISVRHVGGEYFRAMQIRLRRGRFFSDAEDDRSAPVAILSESAARRYFGDVNPVGRRVASTSDHVLREIVGVVADVRFDGPAKSAPDELYLPYRQVPWPAMTIVVTSTMGADEVVAALRRDVRRLDPDQALADIRPMTTIVAASMREQRFLGGLVTVFAILAVALAVTGLYGVMTLFVAERRREFGILMALGAQPADVVQLVVRRGAKLIGVGTGAGLVGAFALRNLLAGLLFGITASNPATYVAAAGVMGVIALVACVVPVRRAVRLDPAQVLRN